MSKKSSMSITGRLALAKSRQTIIRKDAEAVEKKIGDERVARGMAAVQPEKGDLVGYCAHGNAPHKYWYKMPRSPYCPQWFAPCKGCWTAAGGDITKIPVEDVVRWEGGQEVRNIPKEPLAN